MIKKLFETASSINEPWYVKSLKFDAEKKRTLFIANGKDSQTVEAFAHDLEIHKGKHEQISDVSCNMSPAFIKGVRDSFHSAEITFDRFHILNIINEAVDKVRREEVQLHSILRGRRYLFLMNNDNLTKKQKEQLSTKKLSRLNLKTVWALHIREAFKSIYLSKSIREFEILLKKWFWWATHSCIKQMREVAHTIKRYWQGVINWKMFQITNGLLEGLNSLIRAAKSKAKGIQQTEEFQNNCFFSNRQIGFWKNQSCLWNV